MITRLQGALFALLALCTFVLPTVAKDQNTTWITYQSNDGETLYLDNNRRPSLYTQNFGDCLGGSAIEITRFDAAYYHDNMTVLFHLAGNSNLNNQSLMLYIGVFAYGESRFDLTFNPCDANILSLCPLNSSIPITASGIIPINNQDISNVPSMAYSIPDFEGQAILRIFANATEQEVGCYSAVVTNGKSFSHPESVGSVLGIFTFVAMIASFATAIYGEAVPTMRLHYAHSLSVGVVFAVWQHIFYTGALSVNWPSVLPAWWSNFAWAGGMIYSKSMQGSINRLLGNHVGNTSSVGAAAVGSTQESLGGGYDISQIYGRSLPALRRAAAKFQPNHPLVRDIAAETYGGGYSEFVKRSLVSRAADGLANKTSGYMWYGHPVAAGLPLPGNYSGFAGTLAEEEIRASNAFMTGFLWFLILLVLLVATTVAFKWTLEGLVKAKVMKEDRLKFFRDHWIGYTALVALRTCFIGFFMMMFLTIFQFTYDSPGGVTALAAIVFLIFFIGIPAAAAYAIWYKFNTHDDRNTGHQTEKKSLLSRLPFIGTKKTEQEAAAEHSVEQPVIDETKPVKPPLWKRISSMGSLPMTESAIENIHDDDDYTKKFGWLASRFRRTRWWFFAVWIPYEFVRACFYAGASGSPLAQVFGLLVVEVLAFAFVIWARPYEGRRLNVLVVYLLSFSKVACVGLSAAFDVQWGLDRIVTTVIGIVIIIIQGVLTIIVLISVALGAVSSYMSVSRNREEFKPKKWTPLREKYFDHLDRVVNDIPREKPAPAEVRSASLEEPKPPHFEMKSVRRLRKIEDEDADFATEMGQEPDATMSGVNLVDEITPKHKVGSVYATPIQGHSRANSRAGSIRSTKSNSSLPFGARPHRPSWSTREMHEAYGQDRSFTPVDMQREVGEDEPVSRPTSRGNSRRHSRSTPTVQPQTSQDNLRIGGDVSTKDTIGVVPAPTARPRSGTHGSLRASRSNTPTFGESSNRLSNDHLPAQERHSKMPVLTPAQEMEEWGAK